MPQIKARDVRTYIQELGFEKGVVQSLERILDSMAEIRQHAIELTDLASRCVDELGKLNQINDGMKRTIDEIRRIRQQGDERGDLQG